MLYRDIFNTDFSHTHTHTHAPTHGHPHHTHTQTHKHTHILTVVQYITQYGVMGKIIPCYGLATYLKMYKLINILNRSQL